MDLPIEPRLPSSAPSAAPSLAPAGEAVLQPGRNCWRIEDATRAAVLVDAAPYFARLEPALRGACRSIMVLGWDFDGRIAFSRGPDDEPAGERLGPLLRRLVEERPELEVRILVWSVAVVHAPSDAVSLVVGADWQNHPRITLRLDTNHPAYGSHHQKVVVIDDELAFCGGIDLTVDRWDTPEHRVDDPRRRTPDGRPYRAVHDMMMAVEGSAARGLGDLARRRWERATGEALSPPAPRLEAEGRLWPVDLAPDFSDIPVAIARTEPAWNGAREVRESGRLTLDILSAARTLVYVEAQYLASFEVGTILARHLARESGPEVVILVSRRLNGFLETVSMGGNRDRLIRRLKRADRFDRLRVFQPVVPGPAESDCDVFLHAKLLIADDRLLRIGSSNLNNRSMGLDTECDLAVEAGTQAAARAIVALRERLLAEHLGVDPALVKRTVAETGSTVAAIDTLNTGARGLKPYAVGSGPGPTHRVPGSSLLDPKRPFTLADGLRRLVRRKR